MYGVLKKMVKLNEIYFFLCEAQNFLNSPRMFSATEREKLIFEKLH